jgi:hypothetical protein
MAQGTPETPRDSVPCTGKKLTHFPAFVTIGALTNPPARKMIINSCVTASAWTRAMAFAIIMLGSSVPSFAAPGQSGGAKSDAGSSSPGWNLALTGGFVVNGLTDPVWTLGFVPGRTTRVVLRNADRENAASLSIGMFAQMYHDRVPWIAPVSFGVGVHSDGRATFYLGPAFRFGRFASVTAGVAIGPVAALPAGVIENQPVSDTNLLSDLASRTARSWYFGVTYAFASLH